MGRISEISKVQRKFKSRMLENLVLINRGDVFEIGKHRLIYGDATNRDDVKKLMDGNFANMIFTDPPFNLNNDKVGSIASNTNFIMAGGELSIEGFTDFLTKSARNLYDFSANNSIHYICINWKNVLPLMTAAKIYDKYKGSQLYTILH